MKKILLALCVAIIPIIFFVTFSIATRHTSSDAENLKEEKRINGNIKGTFFCNNNYSWQVSTYAHAMPRNSFEGVGGDLYAINTVQLLQSGKIISLSGRKSANGKGPSDSFNSLPILELFQKAAVLPDLRNQILSQEKGSYNFLTDQLWSVYYIHSEDVSDNDFDVIVDCFISNISEINKLYIAPVSENNDTSTGVNRPFGALILQKGSFEKFSNDEYMGFVCDDQKRIYAYDNIIKVSSRDINGKSQKLLVIVGLDGTLHPQIFIDGVGKNDQRYIVTSKDTWALEEFNVLKDRIANRGCVNAHDKNIKDVIQSIPGKIKYLK